MTNSPSEKFVIGESRPYDATDTKPYVRYHPIIGYEYTPNTVQTLPTPAGSQYTISINSAGIRSDREYERERPAGVFRILVFGDSMSAGQFLNNEHRFSELLERRLSNVEVINLSLEGSGTDQQLLTFEHIGARYDFDMVLLFPFLQNIRRNMVDARLARDPVTLQRILLPKPRFDFVGGDLVLRNVPVPRKHVTVAENDHEALRNTDTDVSLAGRLKAGLNRVQLIRNLKRFAYAVIPWEPFPEYRKPMSAAWRLMEAIICRFKQLAGSKPLVIVPVFYLGYLQYRMARNYWDRFSSLATTPGVYVLDLLPYFRRLGDSASRCFLEPEDCHFSAHGHLVLADALEEQLTRLNLLPRGVA